MAGGMTIQDLFDQGYAVRVYNINNDVASWKHGERVIDLPAGTVEIKYVQGDDWPLAVARWSDVLAASKVAA